MRSLISELFMVGVVIAVVLMAVFAARDTIAEGIQGLGTALEDKKANRSLKSKLKSASSAEIRALAIEIFLWDINSTLNWLTTGSMLPNNEKQIQIEQCRRQASEIQEHYSNVLRQMTDQQVAELIKTEFSNRDIRWRQAFLKRSENQRAGNGVPSSDV